MPKDKDDKVKQLPTAIGAIRHIPLNQIEPNEWNPNEMDAKTYSKMKKDIQRTGYIPPLLVMPIGPERYKIVDGYHRWLVAKELNMQTVPCQVLEMDDTEAMLKTVQLNYMRGAAVPIKLANVIHSLNRTMTLAEIEAKLPYEEEELRDDLALLKLPADIEIDMERKAAQERSEEPVFISAVIYRDKPHSLHDFVEQAMLASEATYCEIRVKVECNDRDFDLCVGVMQNLAKLDKSRAADLDGENAPVIVRFALFNDQAQVLDQALCRIIIEEALEKNPRGRALELMAADFLAGAEPERADSDGETEEVQART
jgi:ParB/RepB/Spo0J family partition protein